MESKKKATERLSPEDRKAKRTEFETTLAKSQEDLDRELITREDVMFDYAKFLKDQDRDHFEAEKVFREILEKIGAPSRKLEIYLEILQMTIHQLNTQSVKTDIETCKKILEEGGDWEKKNKLKVFEGVYLMMARDFKKAAQLFLDSIATFTCSELIPYETFVFYTVISAIVTLDRGTIRKKVLHSPDILQSID